MLRASMASGRDLPGASSDKCHPRFGCHAHAQYEHAYAARKHGTRKFRILPEIYR